MPPSFGGKSFVTSNDGMRRTLPHPVADAVAVASMRQDLFVRHLGGHFGRQRLARTRAAAPDRAAAVRSSTSPATAATAPVANAPRLPVSAATAPQMNAPTPWLRSKNDETVATTDARSASDADCSARSKSAGYMQRHADREHDGADDEPADRRPDRDDRRCRPTRAPARCVPERRPPSRSGMRAPTMRTTRISTP